jgi:hypothetical protein
MDDPTRSYDPPFGIADPRHGGSKSAPFLAQFGLELPRGPSVLAPLHLIPVGTYGVARSTVSDWS